MELLCNRQNRQRLFDMSYALQLLGLMLATSMYMDSPTFPKLVSILRLCAFALLGIKLMLDYWDRAFSKKQITIWMLLTLFICGLAFKNSNQHLAYIWLYILGAHDVKFERIVRISYWIHFFCLIFVLGSCFAGIIENYEFQRWNDSWTDYKKRMCLGFTYTTTAPSYFLYMILMQMYLYRERISYLLLLFDTGVVIWLFTQTDTKNAFFTSLLAIIVTTVLKVFWRIRHLPKHGRWFLEFLPLILMIAFGGICITQNFTQGFLAEINNLTTGRLQLTKSAYEEYGIHLFGSDIHWVGFDALMEDTDPYNFVDSAYMQQLYTMGIVFMILVMFVYIRLIQKVWREGNIFFVAALLILAIHATYEPQFFVLHYNVFLLCSGYLLGQEYDLFSPESDKPITSDIC